MGACAPLREPGPLYKATIAWMWILLVPLVLAQAPADRLLLMTDALAQWFLLRTEQGGDALEEIHGLLAESDPETAFAGWIAERRRDQSLRNDDVTLAVIDVMEADAERREDFGKYLAAVPKAAPPENDRLD